MELRKELSVLTSLELPATLIFDYPSVSEMAAALTAMLPAAAPASAAQQRIQAGTLGDKREERPADASAEGLQADWLPQVSSQ